MYVCVYPHYRGQVSIWCVSILTGLFSHTEIMCWVSIIWWHNQHTVRKEQGIRNGTRNTTSVTSGNCTPLFEWQWKQKRFHESSLTGNDFLYDKLELALFESGQVQVSHNTVSPPLSKPLSVPLSTRPLTNKKGWCWRSVEVETYFSKVCSNLDSRRGRRFRGVEGVYQSEVVRRTRKHNSYTNIKYENNLSDNMQECRSLSNCDSSNSTLEKCSCT